MGLGYVDARQDGDVISRRRETISTVETDEDIINS